MEKGRLEAFSDGVIAVIITIMVLELKPPHEATLAALLGNWPVFVSYVLSFVYIGIYWNNHHHMLHACKNVTGTILWANLNLLFWLSLLPFVTGWMGENHFEPLPSALYGLILLTTAMAYLALQTVIIRAQGKGSLLKKAIGGDWKGKLSSVLYVVGMATALKSSMIAQMIYVFVALLWLVPDKRIERVLTEKE